MSCHSAPTPPSFFPSLSKRCFLMGARYKLGGGKGALVRGLHWVLSSPYQLTVLVSSVLPRPHPALSYQKGLLALLEAKGCLKFGSRTGQSQSRAGIPLLPLQVCSGTAPVCLTCKMGGRYLALLARGQGPRLVRLWGPRPASGVW